MKRTIDIKLPALLLVAAAMTGCHYEDFYQTTHPNEGAVVINPDFSQRSEESTFPQSYAIVMDQFGQNASTSEATILNSLLTPGEHTILLYTPVDGFTVSNNRATVNTSRAGYIDPGPDYLYSAVATVQAVADDTVRIAPVMRQLVRRLDIVLTTGEGDYERVVSAVATLNGVASEVDLATAQLTVGAPALITKPFNRDGGTFSVFFRLLGVDPTERQTFEVELTYVDGSSEVVVDDLTELLASFIGGGGNQGYGNMPTLVLTGKLGLQLEAGMSGTIGGWTQVDGSSVDAH